MGMSVRAVGEHSPRSGKAAKNHLTCGARLGNLETW